MCGENVKSCSPPRRSLGSSPRVRGKRTHERSDGPYDGLIPACAGKTIRCARICVKSWAHPRVCGENLIGLQVKPGHPGSSPRVRGKRSRGAYKVNKGRLIPACAGKTIPAYEAINEDRAHPRVCGENYPMLRPFMKAAGSSPRVRGKRERRRRPGREPGLIPACAGKTGSATGGRSSPRAHPRVCGENASTSLAVAWTMGSSPRVRGKH